MFAIVTLVLVALLILLMIRVPIAFALAASGFLGIYLLRGLDSMFATAGALPFQTSARITLIIIPLFILMGLLAVNANIARDVYAFAHRRFARLPGGLGIATIGACAFFAAVTGSSVATAVTMGRVAIAEMRRYRYNLAFAAGIVGAGGTLGVLIPPSVVLVLFGIITGESIGKLLVAGIVPGILSALLYVVAILVRAMLRPQDAPRLTGEAVRSAGAASSPLEDRTATDATVRGSVAALLRAALLFVVVVGGIYSGVATPTEAAALGAFAALLFALWEGRRAGRAGLKSIGVSLQEAASLTGMIFALLLGAAIFTFFLTSAGVPRQTAQWIIELDVPPSLAVLAILLMFIPLGMFLDALSILLIAVPLTYPVVIEMGFDGIWFAILVVKMIELGLITPPVGINAYVVAGSAPGVTVSQAFRGMLWFIPVDILTVLLLFAFPSISTWLPNSMS